MVIEETTPLRIYSHPFPMIRIECDWFVLEQDEFDRLNVYGEQEELAAYRGETEKWREVRSEFRQQVKELLNTRELEPVKWEPIREGSGWSKIKGTEFELSLSKAGA